MMRNKTSIAAIILIIGILPSLSACAYAQPNVQHENDDTRFSEHQTNPNNAPPNDPTQCDDYEDCFDTNGMEIFFDEIVKLTNFYLHNQYPQPTYPTYIYIADNETTTTSCTMTDEANYTVTSVDFFFCPLEDTIYVGQSTLWEFYNELGDAAAAAAIAHEVGHHLQRTANVYSLYDDILLLEMQADCVAGSWSRNMADNGILSNNDFNDIESLMIAIGANHTSERTHGTSQERVEAFTYGYTYGLLGCNNYTPETPLA